MEALDSQWGVAGVQTPAFVERTMRSPAAGLRPGVSPGFRLRPSLSVRGEVPGELLRSGVAGVQTPAFVERPHGP